MIKKSFLALTLGLLCASTATAASVTDYLSLSDFGAWNDDINSSSYGWVYNGMMAPHTIDLSYSNADVKVAADAEIGYYRGEELLGYVTNDPTMIKVYETFTFDGTVIPGSITICCYSVYHGDQDGEYSIRIPDGAFTLNGEPLTGYDYKQSYTKPVQGEVDFTYELDPKDADTVASLGTIAITFPNTNNTLSTLQTGGAVATLKHKDSDFQIECGWADTFSRPNYIVLTFGNQQTEWPDGEYTLTIEPGILSVDQVGFDPYGTTPGNFPGLTANYTLKQPYRPALQDHVSYYLPSAEQANQTNTSFNGKYGMQIIGIGLDSDKFAIDRSGSADWISMSFNGYPLVSADPTKEDQVNIMSVSAMADDELPTYEAQTQLFIFFDPDGFFTEPGAFEKDGVYEVTIPAGVLTYEGQPCKGAKMTYTYTNKKAEVDFEYTLDPNPTTAVADAKELQRITLKFPKATSINYVDGEKPASLTDPDGKPILALTPTFDWESEINFRFGNKDTDWSKKGAYTFTVKENRVAVDIPMQLFDGENGNFPGFTVVYNVGDNNTAVKVLGLDAADSYTVISLDGKVLVRGGNADALLNLNEGLYIINGKKVLLRK